MENEYLKIKKECRRKIKVVDSYTYRYLRDKVYKKYKNKCLDCGKKENLEIHHICYRFKEKPKIKDCILLCSKCHGKRHRSNTITTDFDLYTRKRMIKLSGYPIEKLFDKKLNKKNEEDIRKYWIIVCNEAYEKGLIPYIK